MIPQPIIYVLSAIGMTVIAFAVAGFFRKSRVQLIVDSIYERPHEWKLGKYPSITGSLHHSSGIELWPDFGRIRQPDISRDDLTVREQRQIKSAAIWWAAWKTKQESSHEPS